jgi:hypothetical protein
LSNIKNIKPDDVTFIDFPSLGKVMSEDSVSIAPWTEKITKSVFLPAEVMAKGKHAQAILDLSSWKDIGNDLDGKMSKKITYFPVTARWNVLLFVQYKAAAYWCVARCYLDIAIKDPRAMDHAAFLMTSAAVQADADPNVLTTTAEVRTEIGSVAWKLLQW